MNNPARPDNQASSRRRRRRRVAPAEGASAPAARAPENSLPAAAPPAVTAKARDRSRRVRPGSGRQPEITVVVPLYNEAPSLVELHQRIAAALQELQLPAEMIFVDDGSKDGSFEVLAQLHRRDPRVRVVQFRRNYGKSAALSAGFQRARGRYIVTMDADLQDDPAEIRNLLQALNQGYDLISGWKRHRRDPFIKRATSKIYNRVAGWLTGLRLHDINCGLKIYRSEVTRAIQLYGELHRLLPVLAFKEGFRVGEIVVNHRPRKYGKSKFGPSRFSKGFFDLVTVLFLTRYTKRPLHLFGVLGAVFFLIGLGISVYLTVERLLFMKYLANRPILFLSLLLMIIGVQSIAIGLLGEMITAANPQSPAYSVKAELGAAKR